MKRWLILGLVLILLALAFYGLGFGRGGDELTGSFQKVQSGLQEDSDGDKLLDSDEELYGTYKNRADSDKDGLKDGREVHTVGTDPMVKDSDDDGLTDGDEVKTYDTNPSKADTDKDGVSDGAEVNRGTDPLDADSV